MPTTITAGQIASLMQAGVPVECEADCVNIVAMLDKHGLTLNWEQFVKFIAADPVQLLRVAKNFVGTFNPKP